MKILLFTVLVVLGFSACARVSHDTSFYDRANKANDKALINLEHE